MQLYLDAPAGPGRPPAVLSTHGAQAEPSASLHPPARAALRVGAGHKYNHYSLTIEICFIGL